MFFGIAGGQNAGKYRFAFTGLLKCAYDDCAVTAEMKKGKYTYYRCTGYRGKCALPYFREEELSDRLGGILKDIYIPDDVLAQLTKSLLTDKDREEELVRQQLDRLRHRLASVRHRMDQAYLDKLDGKVPEEFWVRRSAEWQVEEQQILAAMQGLEAPRPQRPLDAIRILELAKAHFLYVRGR